MRRQRSAGPQAHGFHRQVVVQGAAGLEEGVVGQRDQLAVWHDDVGAERHATLGQHPALVVRRDRQGLAIEAVIDAAEDVQVAAGAQHQRTRFAGTGHAGLLRVRIDAGVAVTGQVDVAIDVQVAVRRGAEDGHARTQVEGILVLAQAGQAAIHQPVVGQGARHERHAVVVLAVQVSLVDDLVGAAVRAGVGAGRSVVIRPETIDRDGAGAVDGQRTGRIDGDVVAGGATEAPGAQLQRAQRCDLISLACGTGAQVHVRAGLQHQAAAAGIDVDHGAVGRLDHLAVAVDPQHAAMGVEQRAAGHSDAVARCQADAAHLLAAGVDRAVDGQVAAIHGDRDFARFQFTVQHQVALLELEAAAAEHAALGQALVQSLEILDMLAAHVEAARRERHVGTARVVVAATAAGDAAQQRHAARLRIERAGGELAGAVGNGREIDAGSGRLAHVAVAAVEHHLAAPAVLGHAVEIDLAAGQVEPGAIAQHDVLLGGYAELATWQQHGRVERHAAPVQRHFGAQCAGQGGRIRGRCGRHRWLGDTDVAARLDLVDGAGRAGEQRGVQRQVAAAAQIALAGRIPAALRLVHR
ncbi:hypothetical protein JANLI_58450 [Janthinobacterium lividum]|nr:hypothetical protein JANLI_58450 [Janthinobacterium lividum]